MRRNSFILVCVLALAAVAVPPARAEVIDRIVATVNGHIILLSDWEDSLRYEALSNGRALDGITVEDRKSALDRMIDQDLLREQMRTADIQHASAEEVAQRLAQIRNLYPGAETELGWRAVLDRYRLSEEGVKVHAATELDLLRLVDTRLRPAVNVDSRSIESYYNQELLPQLRRSGAQNVPLAEVTSKIRELLIQKKISQLLTAWLQKLRAGSEIRGESFADGARSQSNE